MKLSLLLNNQEMMSDIISLAKNFGFVNIRLLFDEARKSIPLKLLVDVNRQVGGNADYSSLLEARLEQKLEVEVLVIVKSRVGGIDAVSVVENSISISEKLENIEQHIRENCKASAEELVLKKNSLTGITLRRCLELGDIILEDIAACFAEIEERKETAKHQVDDSEDNLSIASSLPFFKSPHENHKKSSIDEHEKPELASPDAKRIKRESNENCPIKNPS